MRTLTLTVAAAWILALTTAAPAEPKANPNRGRSLFKAHCKACHTQGGEAKPVTPLTKTQVQWQRFFRSGARACLKKVEAKTGKALAAQELADMEAFLVAHAADSDQPETCGGL